MILNVLFIITGIVLVLWGADRLTDGAVAVAEKMKMPQFVIGLTIVAMGTSMPEFCVSLISALRGTSDLAVGNIHRLKHIQCVAHSRRGGTGCPDDDYEEYGEEGHSFFTCCVSNAADNVS